MHVRTTEARTPEDQQAGFKLPPGFRIELFASEPQIGKPMNISFDGKGRLWVTQSSEYPFYDSTGTGSDKVSILEDTNQDGKADKFTTFADSLNIPIGIVPVSDGAIVYSIPYVYHMIDSDGDDQVDERRVLLRGFEHKDTHGMVNNFFRGLDGWIHADHGFSNVSQVVGTDNKEPLTMNSGNTFRFRPDGSGVEFTTTGRVNPFGYAIDEYGYMYSVDCHSSPIYQLVRGADYPHFGKIPSGIGFGPALMPHEYGSTALAGLEYYTGSQFPEEYRQNFYLGDVVKSRVYRSSMSMEGTTPVVTWEPDFIISEDPWFRPVDVKLGPDGALYIADFYNRIIGHYEVPLDHPGRDRERGRIWRITYDSSYQHHQAQDWLTADLQSLIKGLNHPSLTVRMIVADQIVDRYNTQATDDIKTLLDGSNASSDQFIHGLWILFRLGSLEGELINKGLRHPEERTRVHTLRILFEMDDLSVDNLDQVITMITMSSPHIKRAVIMILAKYPNMEQIETLLQLYSAESQEDTHLIYAIKQCLRDHLRNNQVLSKVTGTNWSEVDSKSLAEAMIGVDDSRAAQFILDYLKQTGASTDKLLAYVRHVSKYLPGNKRDDLVKILRGITEGDPDLQIGVYRAMKDGLAQSGSKVEGSGAQWAVELARDFLSEEELISPWKVIPLNDSYRSNPWEYALFEADKNFPQTRLLISGPRQGRGHSDSKLKSPGFSLPDTLRFTLYGQKNQPAQDNEELIPSNWVELFVIGNSTAIRRTEITEEEQRQEISWGLLEYGGQQGYLMVTDVSAAWSEFIGIGNFERDVLKMPEKSLRQTAERQIFACEVVQTFGIEELIPHVEALLVSVTSDVLVKDQAAKALLSISPEYIEVVASVINNPGESEFAKEKLLLSLMDVKDPGVYKVAGSQLEMFPYQKQKSIVLSMANDEKGIDEILRVAGSLILSPKILLEPQINTVLNSNMSEAQKVEFQRLTMNITPYSEENQALIDARVIGFSGINTSVEAGERVFEQSCATCHQINGVGSTIGPQLDGIGNWGLQALTEKILDPNRNVSKAFINYSIETSDGKVVIGLFRRNEGELRIFADPAGQEFSIPIDQISRQTALSFTLMPDNFVTQIPEEDYYHLMKYLLAQK